jgi:hypothetical protein
MCFGAGRGGATRTFLKALGGYGGGKPNAAAATKKEPRDPGTRGRKQD